jgi:hypothetical protein
MRVKPGGDSRLGKKTLIIAKPKVEQKTGIGHFVSGFVVLSASKASEICGPTHHSAGPARKSRAVRLLLRWAP